MKTFMACIGMLSYECDAFKFSKTAKPQIARESRAPYFQGSENWILSTNQYAVDKKYERQSSHRAVSYIFQNIEVRIMVTFY